MNRAILLKRCAIAAILLTISSGLRAQQAPAAAGRPEPPSQQVPATGGDSRPADKVVLKVGDQKVTADDLNFVLRTLNQQDQKAVASQGRRPLGEQYAITLLLAQKASREHLDATPEFQRLESWQRAQNLAEAEYRKMAQAINIDALEVGRYYTEHSKDFEQVEVRQVGIRKKPEGAKPDVPGLTPTDAQARVEVIRKAFAAGTDIKKIAADYAVPNIVFIDPNPQKLQHGRLSPDLDKTIFSLKDGELSKPIDTPQSVFFVQVLRHVQPNLKEVQPTIESTLRQQRLQAEVGDLRKATAIWMDDDYFKAPATAAARPGAAPAANPPAQNPAPK